MSENKKSIAVNRKARHDFHIIETYEAGIALQGTEVKSLRDGRANLRDSYAQVLDHEMYLVDAHISPYSHGNYANHEPLRRRKLLMHRREIDKISGQLLEKGLTLVAMRLYFSRGKAKVELALARGKKEHDKRDSIKQRIVDRETERAIADLRKS
jgi:SsrA-binding protein